MISPPTEKTTFTGTVTRVKIIYCKLGNSCEDFIFGIALKDICHVRNWGLEHGLPTATLVKDTVILPFQGGLVKIKTSQKLPNLQLASRLQD